MTEWTKTLLFVAAAAAALGLATAAQTLSRPTAAKEFERVGEPFFPEFEDPNAARSLAVVTYDEETTAIKPFDVSWGKDGWTISPYGYPADAKEQLQKTAASVIGIEREALASRREADHELYGVIDPLSDDATQLKGRGSRITLKNDKEEILADYIIGKPVEGLDGYYYVRRPKEKETYRAAIDLNLSTRFADWIESDLLGLSASDLRQVQILDYSLDADRGTIASRDQSLLSRKENVGSWSLEGLNEETEQVNTTAVNNLTRVLDELKIIGVRPKPQGLKADLSLDSEIINNQLSAELLRQSLADRGFFLAQDREGNLQLVAQEGQVVATTGDGIVYDLYFGEQFTGSLSELEFGDAKQADAAKQLKEGENKKTETGRYVFIAARFDPTALGEPPAPPATEEKPAGEAPSDTDKQAQSAYEAAKKAWDARVADAQKRVAELNQRFGEWFYVISTENFEDLRVSGDALVSPKSEGTTTTPSGTPTLPMAPAPTAPAPAPTAETPSGESTAPVEATRPAPPASDATAEPPKNET